MKRLITAAARRSVHRAGLTIVLFALTLTVVPQEAQAQQIDLMIGPGVVTFPTTDPDTAPILNAAPLTVQYRVRANGNRPWTLTVLASGNLTSGASTIPASAVSWIATPAPPFRPGTMSATQAQTVAAGTGNVNPTQTGTVTFRLTNSWNYDAGTYLQILTFTLTTP